MTNIGKKYPDFYTVFIAESHYEKMCIPPSFVNWMLSKGKLLTQFILRGHRGRDWFVKAHPFGGKLHLDDGWMQFTEENSLKDKELIVFTHVEDNIFKFTVYHDSSECEKKKVTDDEENNKTTEDKDDAMVDDEDEDDDEDDEEYGGIGSSSSSSVPQLEDDGIDVHMYIKPGNPHFIAKLNRRRPKGLHIPYKVIKHFNLCFEKNITLVCCHCKNVPRNEIAAYHHAPSPMSTTHKQKRGKISTWTDGRVFVLGAVDFCRTSKITENNSILCEFVLNEDRRIKMLKVHDVDPISVYVPIVGDITARVNVPDVSAVQRRRSGSFEIPLKGPDGTSENPFVIW